MQERIYPGNARRNCPGARRRDLLHRLRAAAAAAAAAAGRDCVLYNDNTGTSGITRIAVRAASAAAPAGICASGSTVGAIIITPITAAACASGASGSSTAAASASGV